jgi:hypothetical protein
LQKSQSLRGHRIHPVWLCTSCRVTRGTLEDWIRNSCCDAITNPISIPLAPLLIIVLGIDIGVPKPGLLGSRFLIQLAQAER